MTASVLDIYLQHVYLIIFCATTIHCNTNMFGVYLDHGARNIVDEGGKTFCHFISDCCTRSVSFVVSMACIVVQTCASD